VLILRVICELAILYVLVEDLAT